MKPSSGSSGGFLFISKGPLDFEKCNKKPPPPPTPVLLFVVTPPVLQGAQAV